MHRRSFLTALSSLPFLGWLKPEPEIAPLQLGDDEPLGVCCCCDGIDLPEFDESQLAQWSGWHTVLPCPCGGELGVCVILSDSFHGDGKCGDCGAEYVAHLRHGILSGLPQWHLEPRTPSSPHP